MKETIRHYYNEHDAKAAGWLRELIKRGLLWDGDVDERSIADVQPDDLRGYRQCHFFAGIGGWTRALQLAGWSPARSVWTGSCPCQPFSVAGRGKGASDERHLWPVFAGLIRACEPATVFGEQVASKAGREWLAGVFADLEGMGYRRAGADLCAAGVGAPHIRQRLFWVADLHDARSQGRGECGHGADEWTAGTCSLAGGMADADAPGSKRRGAAAGPEAGTDAGLAMRSANAGGMADVQGAECECERAVSRGVSGGFADGGRMVLSDGDRCEPGSAAAASAGHGDSVVAASEWTEFQLVQCRDGKARRVPIESAFFPLADGIHARVVRLRGYGNAIVPQVAAEFIGAFLEWEHATGEGEA